MLCAKPILKPIAWSGSSYDDLCAFPDEARQDAGFQLHKIQAGLEATDWKPMSDIGPGVAEIRLRTRTGAYRILYLAKLQEAIYVLHCFCKKTRCTADTDKAIARTRYRLLMQLDGSQK